MGRAETRVRRPATVGLGEVAAAGAAGFFFGLPLLAPEVATFLSASLVLVLVLHSVTAAR
jgi:hypothetical protein